MGRSLIQKWFQSLALDLRSLALLRIAYGVCMLQDLAIRATDLTAHYSDWGAQPSYLVTKTSWDPAFFSLHLMQTGREAQALFFLMAAFFSTCFLVGYRTRLAGWLSWFLLISVQNRNPIILDGGDLYLRCLLFWLLFCPLGARWSVDAARRPASSGESESVLHLGTLAYSLQLTLIYGWACALKTGKEWTVDGTAVQYAMRLDGIASPPAQWLLQHPDWMHKLNFAVLYFEGLAPILFWIHPLTRLVAVAGLTAMHLGMASFLHLGAFTLIAACSSWGLLPTAFWRRLPNWSWRPGWRWPLPGGERSLPQAPGAFLSILLVFLLLRVGYCNYWWSRNYTILPRSPDLRLLRLDQQWNMFAPRPLQDDGYYVVAGETRDGDWVNAWIVGAPQFSWEKPARVASQYPNARWRKLMMNICQKEHQRWRSGVMEYLYLRLPKLRSLRLFYVLERTRPDGSEEPLVVQDLGYYCPRELEAVQAPGAYACLSSGREIMNLALQDAH